MHKRKNVSAPNQSAHAGSVDKKVKRAYTAPAVRSAEPLEAVAAVCSPNVPGGPGKELGPLNTGCATLGS